MCNRSWFTLTEIPKSVFKKQGDHVVWTVFRGYILYSFIKIVKSDLRVV